MTTVPIGRRRAAFLYDMLMAGKVPYLAVLLMGAGAFIAGRASVVQRDHVAIAEKGAVVMEAVLRRPGAKADELEREVRQPVLSTLAKYEDQGYVVIDVSRDDQGYMAVAAVPPNAVDITAELRKAVGLSPATASRPAPPAAKAASAADSSSGVKP